MIIILIIYSKDVTGNATFFLSLLIHVCLLNVTIFIHTERREKVRLCFSVSVDNFVAAEDMFPDSFSNRTNNVG